jgi:hypothetical protein
MPRYRRKPTEIAAFKLHGPDDKFAVRELPVFLVQAVVDGVVTVNPDGTADVATLVGRVHGRIGDWVVLDPEGEVCVYEDSAFLQTYERFE